MRTNEKNLISAQNRYRRLRLRNFRNFRCLGNGTGASILDQWRRLRNFGNFCCSGVRRLQFFKKIDGGDRSADWLTPLLVTTLWLLHARVLAIRTLEWFELLKRSILVFVKIIYLFHSNDLNYIIRTMIKKKEKI
jgi:hypothetical protein